MINGVSMNKYMMAGRSGECGPTMPPEIRNLLSVYPSDYTFGGILGTQEINTRASIYRTGTRITVSATNTNYRGA
jgi:hypothetical protein